MAGEPWTYGPTCGCGRCKRTRADRERAQTEALYARHAALLAGVCSPAQFRAAMNAHLGPGADVEVVVSEAALLRLQIERLVVTQGVRVCYRTHRDAVGGEITPDAVEEYIRQFLGSERSLAEMRERAAYLTQAIIERAAESRAEARTAHEEAIHRAVAERRRIAAERAAEVTAAARQRADRAEAEKRIPLFDEMTAPEKEKAVRAMAAEIRAERERGGTNAGTQEAASLPAGETAWPRAREAAAVALNWIGILVLAALAVAALGAFLYGLCLVLQDLTAALRQFVAAIGAFLVLVLKIVGALVVVVAIAVGLSSASKG